MSASAGPSEKTNNLILEERTYNVRWICGVKVEDQVTTTELYNRLNICHLDDILRYNRLRWAGHVHCSASWKNWCQNLKVAGRRGRGRPWIAWKEAITEDILTCGLSKLTWQKTREEWRRGLICYWSSPIPFHGITDFKCMMMTMVMTIGSRWQCDALVEKSISQQIEKLVGSVYLSVYIYIYLSIYISICLYISIY